MLRKLSLSARALWLFLAFFLTSPLLHAAPHFGETFTYRQPDGEAIQVRLYGDEFFAYEETLDGFLIIRDPKSGVFCYASVTPDSSDILSTGVRVGRAVPAGLARKQRLAPGMAMVKSLGNRNLLGVDENGRRNSGKRLVRGKGKEVLNVAVGKSAPQPEPGDGAGSEPPSAPQPAPPDQPTLNKRVGLVLLVSFPDRPGDVNRTVADIDNYCNADTYTLDGNATSIYGYFKIQSNGRLSYKNNVTAWFTAANLRSYYTDTSISYSTRAKELVREGLSVLKAQGFDFTQCDANGDGRLDGVNIFYAGARVNTSSQGLWPHKSSSSWTGLGGTGVTDNYDYQISDMPASLPIGTFCHESGHMICDFPDLYSVDGNAADLGKYSLMAASTTTHPMHVDPYLKILAGWADVVDLSSTSHQRCAVQQDRNFFYRYPNPAKASEYLLLEVRGNAGYEGPWGGATASTNPTSGLVIYHALATGSSNTRSTIFSYNPVTNYNTPYELMVVEAAPSTTLNPWYIDPTPGSNDAFYDAGVSSISDLTTPVSLKFWASDGRTVASGANVHSVSARGNTMSFVIGPGALPATPVTAATATQFEPNADFGQNAASQVFSVFNSGGGTLAYTISDDAAWLNCTPASGTATTEADVITIAYATGALAPGTHSATIMIDGGAAGVQSIPVTLTVNAQATLSVSPGSFSLAGYTTLPGPAASFNLRNTGGGTAVYTMTKTQPWLTLGRTGGTVANEQDLCAFTVDATSLLPGGYNDTITVSAAGASNSPVSIPVTFTVTSLGVLTLDFPAASVSEAAGNAATTGTVSRAGTTGALVVSLVSGNASKITVPSSVTIPDGQTTSAPFNVNAIDNPVIESTASVTITAVAYGYSTVAKAIDVTDNDNTPPVVNAGPGQTVTSAAPPVLGWIYSAWTGDADSGISDSHTYTAAHCFGDNHASVTVNDVTFTEAFASSGTGWSVGGAVNNFGGNDDAAVTGNSEDLAEEFIFNGNPRTVTFSGLTSGRTYEAMFYSVAFENGNRIQTFSGTPQTPLVVNQNIYGNNSGIKISCAYVATGPTQTFIITPTGGTFHLYAMFNRAINVAAINNLNGTASDANGHPLTTAWTLVSGPAGVTFGNSALLNTSAAFPMAGAYVLRLTANDGFTSTYDDAVITVNPPSTGYAVTYSGNSNTGGTAPSSQIKTHDMALPLATNVGNLARVGYIFAGWNTAALGNGTTYAEGASYSANAALALFAKWNMTPYTAWANGSHTYNFTNSDPAIDFDSDCLSNLLEYAFGTDPTVGGNGDLAYTPGGAVTNPGYGIRLNAEQGAGVDFQAIFSRRKDHQAAGLTYAVQFSADLTHWFTTTATPSVLTGDNTQNPAAVEAVSVSYPLLVPVTGGGHIKPAFFRIAVTGP